MTDNKIQVAFQVFEKLDVIIEELETVIKLKNFDIIQYDDRNGRSIFGEKEAITYRCEFSTFNIDFEIKFMTFEYQFKTELIKLHIQCYTPQMEKEMKSCKNFLQRKRNLQLTLITLVAFSRFYESRRLICDFLLRNARNFTVYENGDEGKIVVYSDTHMQVKVAILWTIEWTPEKEVFDKIAVFHKLTTMLMEEDLKRILLDMTEPYLEFDKKITLWYNFVRRISDSELENIENEDDIIVLRSPKLTYIKPEIKEESDEEVDGQESKDEPSATGDQNGRADSPDGSPAAKRKKKTGMMTNCELM